MPRVSNSPNLTQIQLGYFRERGRQLWCEKHRPATAVAIRRCEGARFRNQQVVGSNPTAGSSRFWSSDFGLRTESSRGGFANAEAHAHDEEDSIAFL